MRKLLVRRQPLQQGLWHPHTGSNGTFLLPTAVRFQKRAANNDSLGMSADAGGSLIGSLESRKCKLNRFKLQEK